MSEEIKNPEYLAVRRRQLAQEYNRNMKELGEIKKRKAFKLIELMADHKTVSKAELYFNITEDGQREISLTMECKGIIELVRSLKTEIDIKNNEAFNQY